MGSRSCALFPRLAPMLAVATAGVVVLILIHPWRGQRSPEGLAYWIPAGTGLLSQRGADGSSDSQALAEGIRAYVTHDLRRAIPVLEHATTAGGSEDLRRLYLASAFELRGDGARALETLAPVEAEGLPNGRRNEALWVRYVALVQIGRADDAAALLNRLAGASGPIGELARRRRSATSKAASPGSP